MSNNPQSTTLSSNLNERTNANNINSNLQRCNDSKIKPMQAGREREREREREEKKSISVAAFASLFGSFKTRHPPTKRIIKR